MLPLSGCTLLVQSVEPHIISGTAGITTANIAISFKCMLSELTILKFASEVTELLIYKRSSSGYGFVCLYKAHLQQDNNI